MENHRATFSYDPELVAGIAGRCTEVESGARNVDHILTRTLLPELSAEFLRAHGERQADLGRQGGVESRRDLPLRIRVKEPVAFIHRFVRDCLNSRPLLY